MQLTDIDIKKSYDSDEDDILQQFYIPSLSASIQYDRLAGFFSSTALAAAAAGMHKFVENGGRMRLVTSVYLSDADVLAIEKGLKSRLAVIQNNLSVELIPSKDEFVCDHLKVLSWLVANNRLEIRIAVFKAQDGRLYSSEKLMDKGMFHQKVGILKDESGNVLSFSGSENESLHGLMANIEEFKVFRKWVDDEEEYLLSDIDKFEKFWENRASRVEVIPLPEAIRKSIVRNSPKSIDNVNVQQYYQKKQREIILRDYQLEAVENWRGEGDKGILSIATGCGKTLTGINAIMQILAEKQGISVITAPTRIICKQWKEDLESDLVFENLSVKFDNILLCYSGTGWEKAAPDLIHHLNQGRIKNIVFVVTSTSLKKLISLISKSSRCRILVGDEVHSLGSRQNSKTLKTIKEKGLCDAYLGLSATPNRFYDEEGTDAIRELFGKIVFEYTLRDAIASGRLARYNYHVELVKLTPKELYDYRKLTKKIGRNYAMRGGFDDEEIDSFVLKRAQILKKASGKMPSLRNIFKHLIRARDLDHTIVFCEDKSQLKGAAQLLSDLKMYDFSQITEEVTEQHRDMIIDKFKKKLLSVILSITIFNEGVDIKQAKTAIILSSTTNPREYIQRRGRVLRKEEGSRKTANIYDFLVYADPKLIAGNDVERRMVHKELDRMSYFAKDAVNFHEILDDKELLNIAKAAGFTGLF